MRLTDTRRARWKKDLATAARLIEKVDQEMLAIRLTSTGSTFQEVDEARRDLKPLAVLTPVAVPIIIGRIK